MKTTYCRAAMALGSVIILSTIFSGCINNDIYDPDYSKKQLPSIDTYFDFGLTTQVKLNLDYDLPGCKALIEVYGEDPIDYTSAALDKRKDVEALFKIFTDDNGKYEGNMSIPTALTHVYIYSDASGIPQCLILPINDGSVTFSGKRVAEAGSRAYGFNALPYELSKQKSLYSIVSWGEGGVLNQGMYTRITSVGSEVIGSYGQRIKDSLKPEHNEEYLSNAERTNIYISPVAADGDEIVNASIDLIFVERNGAFCNTFGYYYYKGITPPADISSVKKYVIFPNVSKSLYFTRSWNSSLKTILKPGDKVSLKFFGEDGNEEGTTLFPAGYSIGWFLIKDGYSRRFYNSGSDNDQWRVNGERTGNSDEINASMDIYTSNDTNQRFISLYDVRSKKLIVGAEDDADYSCQDILFYAEADPMKAIVDPENPGKPSIPDGGGDIVIPDAVETTSGTLAFEDIWPTGGDYDMNDVAVEYTREVTFDKDNNVKKIVDTFKPTNDGASYVNAFAYQIDANQMGTVTLPEGSLKEDATNSIIVFADAKKAVADNKSYTITRDLTGSGVKKQDLKPYNPYIIVEYAAGSTSRAEVHLPKQLGTIYADKSLNYTENDAYYIQKDGKYPFAIDVPIKSFIFATETHHIDDDDQYPDFKTWADSKGTLSTDWYNNYKGKK